MKVGSRVRIDRQLHEWDGRIGTVELIDGPTAYVMREGKTLRLPLDSLRINGVLQNVPEHVAQKDHFVRLFEVLGTVHI